jgi:hypothetical protein
MIYLLLIAVLIAVGVAIVMIRHRGPSGMHHHISHFEKRRDALAPRERHSRFRHREDR